jgi:precorrin-3B synthase
MNAAPEIKGWCPGALRPMQSGDGLLLRAKTVGSRLSAGQAQGIAATASICGNGLLDLSQRAQFQLRGVSEETLVKALRGLNDIGLLAPDAETESILNIIAPPLSGLDEASAFEADKLVAELAAAFVNDRSLRALPGKFCFLVDDGADPGLLDVAADIRLERLAKSDGGCVAVVLDGARDKAILVSPNQAVAAALAMARAFLALRKGREFELRRMRWVVKAYGGEALAREAGFALTPYRSTCRSAKRRDVFGVHEFGSLWFAGVGAPFGRWRASDLATLAERAAASGIGELRLSPWRAILIPAGTRAAAETIAEATAKLGLIVGGDDPRLSVIACPGAPECPQARGATREAAERLAPLAHELAKCDENVTIHVSGCAKGCARPETAFATLVANGAGFDFVTNGRACDQPSRTALAFEEIEDALRARSGVGAGFEAQSKEAPCPVH